MHALLGIFYSSISWKFYHSVLVLSVVLTNFFAVTMVSFGVVDRFVLLYLSLYLMFSFVYVTVLKGHYTVYSKRIKQISLFVASLCLLSFPRLLDFNLHLAAIAYICALSMTTGLVDMSLSKCNWAVEQASKQKGFTSLYTLSISSFVCAILIACAFPLFGMFADVDVSVFVYLVAVFLILVGIFMAGCSDKEQSKVSSRFRHSITKRDWQYLVLSPIYSSIVFLGRLYILPLYFVGAATHYGFDEGVFGYLGVFLGIVIVVALCSKPLSSCLGFKSRAVMLFGFVIGISAWICMAALSQYEYSFANLSAFVVCYVLFDLSANFWNGGYMASLSDLSIQNSKSEEDRSQLHTFYITFNAQITRLSISCFFLIYFFFYDFFRPEYLVCFFGFMALLYACYFFEKTKPE